MVLMRRTNSPSRTLKSFPTELAGIRAGLPADTEIEIWWQDEARIGQKNKTTRRWAKRGTPSGSSALRKNALLAA